VEEKDLKIIVKIGGRAMEENSLLASCASAVSELVADGHQVAVVHGGGAALTRTLAKLGKGSTFVNGFRVTDAETRDTALMVLAGLMNKTLVAAVLKAGQLAVGLCGGDGGFIRARKKNNTDGDLGFVGEVSSVNTQWLDAIWNCSAVPVISSMALGTDGEYYNVNADQMATACAIACKANALVFLTDVPGVKDAQGNVLRWLDVQQMPVLVESKVVSGGMLPKLDACRNALLNGVGRVRILPATEAGVLPKFFQQKIECGTEVMVA